MPEEHPTVEEIGEKLFACSERYPQAQWYDFRSDSDFLGYLGEHFTDVAGFYAGGSYEFRRTESPAIIAAIGISPATRKPRLFLNPHKMTYLHTEVVKGAGPRKVFEFQACLLWHEMLHVVLRHFAVPFASYDAERLNIVQDMQIDNWIHRKVPGWRNWRRPVEMLNAAIEERGMQQQFSPISLDPESGNSILNLADLDLYVYLTRFIPVEPDQPSRLDHHEWTDGPPPTAPPDLEVPGRPGEGGQGGEGEDAGDEGEGSGQGEEGADEGGAAGDGGDALADIMEELCQKARERLDENAGRAVAAASGATVGDEILARVGEGRAHDLLAILRRYMQAISRKRKSNSWKVSSRKLPGLRPGVRYKRQPGEILIVVDRSGSMQEFIARHLVTVMSAIHTAFTQIARTSSVPAMLFTSSVNETVMDFDKVEDLETLLRVSRRSDGGTDYRPIFEKVLEWKEAAGSSQSLPDLVMFISDLDTDTGFLADPRFAGLGRRLVWLYAGSPGRPRIEPAIGEVVDMLARDWYTSIR